MGRCASVRYAWPPHGLLNTPVRWPRWTVRAAGHSGRGSVGHPITGLVIRLVFTRTGEVRSAYWPKGRKLLNKLH